MKKSSLTSRDFSQLPQELLAIIANFLSPSADFLRFSAACRSWRSVASKQNYPPLHQMPYLMLAEDDESPDMTTRLFFSPSDQITHELHLPEARNTKLVGSTDGWLVMVTDDLQVVMLNPMSRSSIDLPPLSSLHAFAGFEGQCVWPTPIEKRDWLLRRVCLSPGAPGDRMAMALYGHLKLTLAFPGDSSWTKLCNKKFWPFCDVIYFKDAFHAVNHKGEVVACRVLRDDKSIRLERVAPRLCETLGACMKYLVESSGDLLQVARDVRVLGEATCLTVGFTVFRWRERWEEVRSLGDRAIFIGVNSSVSVCAPDMDGCRSNCIYFTDDNVEMYSFCKGGGADIGVYDLEDGSIMPLYTGRNSRSMVSPPVWVQPTIWKRGP